MTALELGSPAPCGRRRHRHHGPGHRPGRPGRRPPRAALRRRAGPRPGGRGRDRRAPRPAGRQGPARPRAERDAARARLRPAGNLAELADAALVVEAVLERLDVKQQLFARPGGRSSRTTACSPPTPRPCRSPPSAAPCASPAASSACTSSTPRRCCRWSRWSPARATDVTAATRAYETARAWGKTPVALRRHPRLHRQPHRPPLLRRGLRGLRGAGRRPRHHRRGPARVRRLQDGRLRADRPHRPGRQRGRHPLRVGGLLPGREVHARRSPSAGWSSPAGTAARRAAAGTRTRTASERPEPHTAQPAQAPAYVVAEGDLGPAAELLALIREAGIPVREEDEDNGTRLVLPSGGQLALADGQTVRRVPRRRLLRPRARLPRRDPDRAVATSQDTVRRRPSPRPPGSSRRSARTSASSGTCPA